MRSCGGDGSHGLYSFGCETTGQMWNWRVGAGGGGACTRLHMDFYAADCEWGNDVGGCNDYADVPADDMASATWQHVAVTYDGTTLVGYRNGAEIARSDPTVAPITCATDDTTTVGGYMFNIGAACSNPSTTPGGSDPFFGQMDEVAIFGAALSAADVAAVYNNGLGLSLAGENTVASVGTNQVYIDGSIAGSPVAGQEFIAVDASTSVYAGEYFRGAIDEMAVFSMELTAENVFAIFNSGNGTYLRNGTQEERALMLQHDKSELVWDDALQYLDDTNQQPRCKWSDGSAWHSEVLSGFFYRDVSGSVAMESFGGGALHLSKVCLDRPASWRDGAFSTTPSCPARDVLEARFDGWCREQFQDGEECEAMCIQQGVCRIDGGNGLSPKAERPLICKSHNCNKGYKGAQMCHIHV